jgi:hypothetical protein
MSKLILAFFRDVACVHLNILPEWLTNASLSVYLQIRALESRLHHQYLLLTIVLVVFWLLLLVLVYLPSCRSIVTA